MSYTSQLLSEIETHLASSGISATAFGVAAINDPHLVHDLRAARRSITLATADRIRAYIRGEKPSGLTSPPSPDSPLEAQGVMA